MQCVKERRGEEEGVLKRERGKEREREGGEKREGR